MLGYWLGCIPCWVIGCECIPCWVIGWDVFHVGLLVGMYSMLDHWLSCIPCWVIG